MPEAPDHEPPGHDRAHAGSPGHERERRQSQSVDGSSQHTQHPEQAGRRHDGQAPEQPAPLFVHPVMVRGRSGSAGTPLSSGHPEPNAGEWNAELAEDLDRDEESGEEEDDGHQLGDGERCGDAEAIEAVAGRCHERPDGDEQGCRDTAVEPPRQQRLHGSRQRRDEVHGERDRRDEQVEQELVARLVGIQRILKHAALGHEQIGREQRAEQQREAASHVEERREQAEGARKQSRGGLARLRVQDEPRRRQRCRDHERDRQERRAQDAECRDPRPALVLEVRLDGHGEAEDRRADEVDDRAGAGARIVELALRQEREQAPEEEHEREGIPEPRAVQEECGAEAEPAGGPDGPGQVPRPVERLVPAGRRGDRLAACSDAEEPHPDCPDQLERLASLPPLVQQGRGESERQDGRQCLNEGRHQPSEVRDRRTRRVNGTRNSRNTSADTRKPRKRNRTPRNSPTKNALVAPNRLATLVIAGMSPPMAMRMVAGTREWRRPVSSATTAPGIEARKLTTMATIATRKVNRVRPRPRSYRIRRCLGMKTYVEYNAPNVSANAPVTLKNGVSRRMEPGKSVPTGMSVAGSRAYPGAASGVIATRPRESTEPPTIAAPASHTQRSSRRAVRTTTPIARTSAAAP